MPIDSTPLGPLTLAPVVVDEVGWGSNVKRKVEVSLLGKRFTVRSEKDEAYLHAISNFVTRRFEELQHASRMQSTHDVALLVALNLADELFQAEERHAKSRSEVRSRTERMLEHIETAMAEIDEDVGSEDRVAVAVEHQA